MSHHTTLLSQTPSLLLRHVFQKLEKRHETGLSTHKFGDMKQFTAMALIQPAAHRLP